jgi:hypothetical protein
MGASRWQASTEADDDGGGCVKPRTSDVAAMSPVRVLRPCQVWDERGCFYTHLQTTKSRHQGRPVYKDGFGQRLVIAEAA